MEGRHQLRRSERVKSRSRSRGREGAYDDGYNLRPTPIKRKKFRIYIRDESSSPSVSSTPPRRSERSRSRTRHLNVNSQWSSYSASEVDLGGRYVKAGIPKPFKKQVTRFTHKKQSSAAGSKPFPSVAGAVRMNASISPKTPPAMARAKKHADLSHRLNLNLSPYQGVRISTGRFRETNPALRSVYASVYGHSKQVNVTQRLEQINEERRIQPVQARASPQPGPSSARGHPVSIKMEGESESEDEFLSQQNEAEQPLLQGQVDPSVLAEMKVEAPEPDEMQTIDDAQADVDDEDEETLDSAEFEDVSLDDQSSDEDEEEEKKTSRWAWCVIA